MKKAFVVLSALLFTSSFTFGKERTQAEMDSIAKSVHTAFTLRARSLEGMATRDNLILDAVSSDALNRQLREAFPDINKDFFAVYSSQKGESRFAIISTDDHLPALIGFSDTQSFATNDMPPAMLALLTQYVHRMNDIPNRTTSMHRADAPMELEPLLGDINFSQGSPYNDMCPLLNGKRTATGCLATAMAQIMAYYKYPTQMLGEKIEYLTETHSLPISWDCPNTRFDWDNILDTYPSATIPDYTANETTTSTQYMYFSDITLSDKNKLEIANFYSLNKQTMTFDLQLLLCDNTGRFIRPVGEQRTIKDLKPRYGWGSYPINHSLPADIADGNYRLYLGVRLADTSVWSMVQRVNQKNQLEEFYLNLTKHGMSYTMEGRRFACAHTKVQGEAIATLLAACGASAGMNYAEQSSTGYAKIGSGLIGYMGYNDGIYFLYSNSMPSRQFIEQTMEAELLERRPIYCCGTTSEEGAHAYIIDGFQYYQGTTPYYHINWGWNGDDNGFFLLDAMTTSGGDNYSYYYFLGMGIQPSNGQDLGILFYVNNITASVVDRKLNLSLEKIYNRTLTELCGSMNIYAVDGKGKEYFLKQYHWNSWKSFLGYEKWENTIDIPQDLPDGEYTIVLKMKRDESTFERNVLTPEFPKVTIGNGGSAIADIPAAAPPQGDIFTLSGRKLPPTSSDNLPKGLYISKGKKYISK